MKVALTSDQKGPNPNFDYRKRRGPDNRANIIIPAGTIIDHPEAHYLVINGQAEPIDEESHAAYARYLRRKETALQGNRPALPAVAFSAPSDAGMPPTVEVTPNKSPALREEVASTLEPATPVVGTPAVSEPPVTPFPGLKELPKAA